MYTKILIALAACMVFNAHAHGGRTNAQGCHNDRKNGGYHCHGGSSTTESSTAIERQRAVAPKSESVAEDFSVCVRTIQQMAQTYPAQVVLNTQEAYSVKIMHPTEPQTITCFATHSKSIEQHY